MGMAAYSVLLEHLDDDRYSYTTLISSYGNINVGQACLYIISKQVELIDTYYPDRKGKDGLLHHQPTYFQKYYEWPIDVKRVKRWWDERSIRSLNEIQIEILQWIINEEIKIGYESEEDKEIYLKPLQNKLTKLIESLKSKS